MAKKMLIDATHKEETRVVITDGNKLIEYDYESKNRKPLKGSIFLAKVTRVEPSLQAAFVSFGGNRHGFLPFSEIHPDYFRIPVADREALIAEQEALIQEHDNEEALIEEGDDDTVIVDEEDATAPEEVDSDNATLPKKDTKDTKKKSAKKSEKDSVAVESKSSEENKDATANKDDKDTTKEAPLGDASEDGEDKTEATAEGDTTADSDDNKKNRRRRGNYRGRGRGGNKRAQYNNRNVEVVGGEEIDDKQHFRFNLRRKYRIQEVIKRGQIMLVQANKEERGNKGAAVGSYLSLPGRYCVLMPNSPRGGGVSRKIANSKDRARMRDIVKELDVPKGMSVIVRTAGVCRTKAEIKRDLDYLMRLWDNIRELTLQSTAPALVYEEADLIKRSIRDLYTSDIDEIYVAGEEGYDIAKSFMKMMMPSHAKKVKFYDGQSLPLFNRYQLESQINEIGQPDVRLKSGGYLVINPTEALISIDVNSGKSTKGRHIEETALKTNLEAAEEVARQLKLRDLGGLVVIDFIDMENRGNNAKVERRMKEALSTDRARVQVGRISSFGLMELSRQRLSPSLIEAQFEQCNNCTGLGLTRTADAMSIIVLRAIEEEGIRARASQLIVQVTGNVALYILNHKRRKLAQIEEKYNLEILIRIDDKIPASEYLVEVSKPAEKDNDNDSDGVVTPSEEKDTTNNSDDNDNNRSRRRGRRGGRNRNNRQDNTEQDGNNVEKIQTSDEKDGNIAKKPVTVSEESSDVNGNKSTKPTKAKHAPKKKIDIKTKSGDTPNKEVKLEDNTTGPANDDNVKDIKSVPKEKPKPAAKKAVSKKKESVATEPKKDIKKSIDEETPSIASMHETVNQAPKQKKKGWWNRL